MAAKKKDESLIQKIVAGVIVSVLSSLILAYCWGAFGSKDNSTTSAAGGRPGATKIK